MIYKIIDENEFINEFRRHNRENNFSIEALRELYNYYNELENFELDVIAICCEWVEMDKEEVLKQYGDEGENLEDVLRYIENSTILSRLSESYLFIQF